MAKGSGVPQLHTGFDVREYTYASGQIDLMADGPFTNAPARYLMVLDAKSADNLVIITDSEETRTLSAGLWLNKVIMVATRSIEVGTTVDVVVAVFW